MYKKKLIEVALPLEAINAASAREKSIRHGHPSTLHLWWARRPLATARAVIWASLVDDPSSHPEEFPTEELQNKERERLFKILEDLVVWENSNNEMVLEKAKAEIMNSTEGNPPEFLDPFAGGGALPLEAQRLGLVAHAHDLNPVALTINKAMIEIPPKFAGYRPVNPEAQELWTNKKVQDGDFPGTIGLEEDVRYYGELLKKRAEEKIGYLYPKAKTKNGKEVTVIAWIWARTIKCPNPACGYETPLANTFELSKKKGNQRWIHPEEKKETKSYAFSVSNQPSTYDNPKINKGKFKCIHCGEAIPPENIREQLHEHKGKEVMMAVVAEGEKGRLYLSPDEIQINAAAVEKPEDYPTGELMGKSADSVPLYGFEDYSDLFTNRQLTMLTTLSSLMKEMIPEIEKNAIEAGLANDGIGLENGGTGAKAYAEGIAVYLAILIDKLTDYHSSMCSWNANRDQTRNVFGRQAIPMVWDFVEGNPFCSSSGSFENMLTWIEKSLHELPASKHGYTKQQDAQSDPRLRNLMISTDPPYYDNIEYADLSDYFYVWLRWNLKSIFPDLLATLQVPKEEELVASPYRHKSKKAAKDFFEHGMVNACKQIYTASGNQIPVTIYYAYKQSDSEQKNGKDSVASSGWETMLSSIIEAGFYITGTWPMRTERAGRTIGNGANALASSIVLVCRKRDENAKTVTRKKFVTELKKELKVALEKLQRSNIAPVDMAQSAIGPGMGVFSKYKAVLEADGTPMTVRSALEVINQEVDLFFNEQGNNMSPEDRFCIDLYTQAAFNDIKYGDADTLARAKNTSVEKMTKIGILYAEKGRVHLLPREELKEGNDLRYTLWIIAQVMTHKMETGGIDAVAQFIEKYFDANIMADHAKNLVYRLFTIADKKKWTNEATAYNNLVLSWPDIEERLAEIHQKTYVQTKLFDESD